MSRSRPDEHEHQRERDEQEDSGDDLDVERVRGVQANEVTTLPAHHVDHERTDEAQQAGAQDHGDERDEVGEHAPLPLLCRVEHAGAVARWRDGVGLSGSRLLVRRRRGGGGQLATRRTRGVRLGLLRGRVVSQSSGRVLVSIETHRAPFGPASVSSGGSGLTCQATQRRGAGHGAVTIDDPSRDRSRRSRSA